MGPEPWIPAVINHSTRVLKRTCSRTSIASTVQTAMVRVWSVWQDAWHHPRAPKWGRCRVARGRPSRAAVQNPVTSAGRPGCGREGDQEGSPGRWSPTPTPVGGPSRMPISWRPFLRDGGALALRSDGPGDGPQKSTFRRDETYPLQIMMSLPCFVPGPPGLQGTEQKRKGPGFGKDSL